MSKLFGSVLLCLGLACPLRALIIRALIAKEKRTQSWKLVRRCIFAAFFRLSISSRYYHVVDDDDDDGDGEIDKYVTRFEIATQNKQAFKCYAIWT